MKLKLSLLLLAFLAATLPVSAGPEEGGGTWVADEGENPKVVLPSEAFETAEITAASVMIDELPERAIRVSIDPGFESGDWNLEGAACFTEDAAFAGLLGLLLGGNGSVSGLSSQTAGLDACAEDSPLYVAVYAKFLTNKPPEGWNVWEIFLTTEEGISVAREQFYDNRLSNIEDWTRIVLSFEGIQELLPTRSVTLYSGVNFGNLATDYNAVYNDGFGLWCLPPEEPEPELVPRIYLPLVIRGGW